MLSPDGLRKFYRAIEECRRGKVSSMNIGADVLARMSDRGLRVMESEPDLGAMAAALTAAGYKVEAPADVLQTEVRAPADG